MPDTLKRVVTNDFVFFVAESPEELVSERGVGIPMGIIQIAKNADTGATKAFFGTYRFRKETSNGGTAYLHNAVTSGDMTLSGTTPKTPTSMGFDKNVILEQFNKILKEYLLPETYGKFYETPLKSAMVDPDLMFRFWNPASSDGGVYVLAPGILRSPLVEFTNSRSSNVEVFVTYANDKERPAENLYLKIHPSIFDQIWNECHPVRTDRRSSVEAVDYLTYREDAYEILMDIVCTIENHALQLYRRDAYSQEQTNGVESIYFQGLWSKETGHYDLLYSAERKTSDAKEPKDLFAIV